MKICDHLDHTTVYRHFGAKLRFHFQGITQPINTVQQFEDSKSSKKNSSYPHTYIQFFSVQSLHTDVHPY